MEKGIQIYTYNGQDIEFDLANENVMINATEMALPFGKKVEHFTRLDQTKNFIKTLILNPNVGLISEKQVLVSTKKTGTWMHRLLALKFAAWLNADFELWVYTTIDKVLYGSLKEIENGNKMKAALITEVEGLKRELRVENPKFIEFEKKQTQLRQLSYQIGKANQSQLQLLLN